MTHASSPRLRLELAARHGTIELLEVGVDIEKTGFGDVSLMDGETIDSAISLTAGLNGDYARDPDVILLTDKRIIRLTAEGRRHNAVFVALQNIDAVEITTQREGYGAFLWGGLSFFVAIMLWKVWDHPLGSGLAAAAVALMGVYLVLDRIFSPGTVQASFKAGSSQVMCGLKSDQASRDIYPFVSRLYQLKSRVAEDGTRGAGSFAPR